MELLPKRYAKYRDPKPFYICIWKLLITRLSFGWKNVDRFDGKYEHVTETSISLYYTKHLSHRFPFTRKHVSNTLLIIIYNLKTYQINVSKQFQF